MLNVKQYFCSPIFKILILFFYLCTISSAFSQTDSLATKSYDELTKLYVQNIGKNPATALVYMQKAHEVAKQTNDTAEIARTFYGLAYCNFYLTNNSKTLQYVEKAIPLLLKEEEKNGVMLYQCFNLKGMVFTDMGENSKALNSHIMAKEYAKKNRNIRNEIITASNIAFIKKMHKNYTEAIKIFKESLAVLEKSNIDDETKLSYELSLYVNIADTYLRMKETTGEDYIKEARYYSNLGLRKCSKTTHTIVYYNLLLTEIVIRFEEGIYQESITLAEEVVTYAKEDNNEATLCNAYFYIGKSYAKLKKYQQAITYLEMVDSLIQKSEKSYSNERQLNRILAVCYTAIGEIEKGQARLERYIGLFDQERVDDVKVMNEVYVKNDIPELISELEELKKIILATEKKKQQLYFIAGILTVLLIFSIGWYRKKVKKVKKHVSDVLKKVAELEKIQVQEKNKTSTISEKVTDQKAALILEKLKKFEEKEEYLSIDCSLSYVADKLQSNTSYISNVINNYKHKTFKAYITELRINAALIRLKNDDKLRSYTIQAIAEEFGFKRQETFSKAFKQETGIYPSQYLKKLREKE
ncbi:AraC family transcriptional regulator [Kordia sp. YSTF-M3]|uniref:AraC family transcriptional regulator n=1 Tax=Kordia aestuariivivens TaxID=2759037 RepID=A0ABR7Q8L5_9FLAO|nr:helix-turn-helix domain-containing protein [Kordia aestuariivivens]MBC8754906.1 AraC family transcriptional regulator [Kordia aestuariivivens]